MLQVGDVLDGEYEIEALLGEGGMGAVFRAKDTQLERYVAIKELRFGDLPSENDPSFNQEETVQKGKGSKLWTREAALRLFDKEAKLLASLNHSGLPVVFHYSVHGSEAYMVMTLIEGRNLAVEVEENHAPLPESTVLRYLKQILNALHYCHNKGVVHRDLKPENLLLTSAGQIYLIDFGIAKSLNPGQRTTAAGVRLLTPGYAPPEQYSMKGAPDPRSDLYSLGAVIFYLLTGEVPPEATDRMAGEKLPLPSSLNPNISKRMENFILCCLEMDKEKRPASAAATRDLLLPPEEVPGKAGQPILPDAGPPPPHRSRTKTQEPTISPPVKIEQVSLELTRGIRMEFVCVPAGDFRMGATTGDGSAKSDDEGKPHWVYLDEYWMGKYPVTNAQYKVFVQEKGINPPIHWEAGKMPKKLADHPVVNVSWLDATAFCEWVSLKTGKNVRLPSEAEWEKAARGNNEWRYPWGNKDPKGRCNHAQLAKGTTPVGNFSPQGDSPYGCADMAGNVLEWVTDRYGKYSEQYQRNPLGPPSGTSRVLRGGSWYDSLFYVRVSNRRCDVPANKSDNIGFRCALGKISTRGS